jgi:XTP/dITP diphosphohydrolase
MTLRCATTNPGKAREFAMAASHFGFPEIGIEPLAGMRQVPSCVEDGATFEANAVKKALYYSALSDDLVFADDSGLEVDALGGAPGVISARYSPSGSDLENNRLLIRNLRGVADRRARFVCVIALAHRGKLLGTFRGAVEGEIVDDRRGENGFGYDPHFYHPPFGCTFGEAGDDRKMSVSHRGQALRGLLTFCRERGGSTAPSR